MLNWLTPEEIRCYLASEEMTYDPMYQPSMDSMWHHWLQPKWAKEFEAWNETWKKEYLILHKKV